jgi:NAD+ synthase (glutamine-hydrolysing)
MCEDHSKEYDTEIHSWQVVEELIESKVSNSILCDIGMRLMHKDVLYNCRIE